MIERYQTAEMANIWEEESKFSLWLEIELAALDAKAKLGRLDSEIAQKIRQQAKFTIARIKEIEAEIEHDLLAFVQTVRENLDPGLRRYFHEGMTSFDTEEIPLNLRLIRSLEVLSREIKVLCQASREQAKQHKTTLMIGRTHGQHAKPITFGFKLLGWLDAFDRDGLRLNGDLRAVSVGKLSGAVGIYGGELDPELEEEVCRIFKLKPVRHATQIIHRDRVAQVMSTLAILAANMEYVATEIRHLAQTEIGEVYEPRKKAQKGSSAMPHKRNPIICERICGLARIVRIDLVAALENITTWSERDISHSSVERVILPDSFHAIHYMLRKLIWVVQNMEVDTERMLENLRFTQGCIFSEEVKTLLCSWGIDTETVYYLLQESSFTAMKEKRSFQNVLLERGSQYFNSSGRIQALDVCFDETRCLKHIDKIFARFGS